MTDSTKVDFSELLEILNKTAEYIQHLEGFSEEPEIILIVYKVINDTWTEANGCMTPTLKIKRNVIVKRLKAEIDSLFE